MVYKIEFDIAAIFLTLFIIYYIIFKKGLSKHANRVYLTMLVINFIAEISDVVASLANNNPGFYALFFHAFWNYLYLLSHNLMALMIVVYLFYLIGYEKRKKVALQLITIPYAIDVVLLLTNPIHKWVFYFDESGHYTHGPLFFILYLIASLYMLYAFYLAIKHRVGISSDKSQALIFFLSITFIPVILQMFFQEYLLTLFFETMGLMGILLTIESKDDIINPTTGLLNRFALQTVIDRVMSGGGYTVILIKIPNLNYYNKMIGFESMNAILHRIAKWIGTLSNEITCYDCGRGHFALLCEGMSSVGIDRIRKATMERFSSPWGKGKFSIVFPVQFGVVNLPDDVKTMENLFMLIDEPFDGKIASELDVEKVIGGYERNVLVERLIDKALKNRSLQVYYQPIWDYKSGEVHSAEALCRLIDEEYGMIPPDEFIPISERNGSILEIGRFVFEEVCKCYKEESLKALGVEYIEVNLSVVQCMSSDLYTVFDSILKKYSLDASCINLEITESATAQNRKSLFDTIDALKTRGFNFSLDDYGTGYSNISYMYEMPFSIIKIDKSILWKAIDPKTGKGEENALIYLENTVRMLKAMNYKVLVEGVETMEQKMLLESLQVDYLQGYYFSKPVKKKVFTDFIRVVDA